ncbi:MAG TPA: hypothetical protein VFI24_07765 [Pyrinomonadaceae bacterium]|nr:hypothetical protein [Pyrinomonadaceae bacterium]
MKGNKYQRLIFIVAVLCLSSSAQAHTDDLPYRFHPGLRISHTKPLTTRELTVLIGELSALSGLRLNVDVAGTIHYDTESPAVGGSAIARELLVKAIDASDSFSVESANQSAQVAFAQIESTMSYRDGINPQRNVWVIRIDFADFAQLRGDAAAVKAFNPGMNLMHELTHAIVGLPDPDGPNDQLGECERYLNLMRAELGLPLRQYYFPKTRLARSPASLSQILQGEFKFTQGATLTFNVAMVVDTERMKSTVLCFKNA